MAFGVQAPSGVLRIERESDGCVTRLRLSGRIQSGCLASIRSAMGGACTSKVLELADVTLVDIAVVRFLVSCEDEGVQLLECPPYVREWMIRERDEAKRSESAHGT